MTAVRDNAATDRGVSLVPYLPGVAVDWILDDPARTWRELDGSLVFVDVSGFTALSERLAKRGRVGAEELTEVIGTCFAEMLAAAYRLSGSLLKFGGDALLLLFTGPEHALRATRSAVHMREALRLLGRVETSAGAVRLRASIGVHSGPVLLCLVGESHREFTLTGPDRERRRRHGGRGERGRDPREPGDPRTDPRQLPDDPARARVPAAGAVADGHRHRRPRAGAPGPRRRRRAARAARAPALGHRRARAPHRDRRLRALRRRRRARRRARPGVRRRRGRRAGTRRAGGGRRGVGHVPRHRHRPRRRQGHPRRRARRSRAATTRGECSAPSAASSTHR